MKDILCFFSAILTFSFVSFQTLDVLGHNDLFFCLFVCLFLFFMFDWLCHFVCLGGWLGFEVRLVVSVGSRDPETCRWTGNWRPYESGSTQEVDFILYTLRKWKVFIILLTFIFTGFATFCFLVNMTHTLNANELDLTVHYVVLQLIYLLLLLS